MTLKELVEIADKASTEKGFREKPIETGTLLMLMVSELSEALEAHRRPDGGRANMTKFDEEMTKHGMITSSYDNHIKGTIEEEMADVVIRVADFCGRFNIDLEEQVRLKLLYNKNRPKKHGKEY